jgi:hypothetical protein
MRPHKLRFFSDFLHNLAMVLPLPIARPVAKLSSKFYYTK